LVFPKIYKVRWYCGFWWRSNDQACWTSRWVDHT